MLLAHFFTTPKHVLTGTRRLTAITSLSFASLTRPHFPSVYSLPSPSEHPSLALGPAPDKTQARKPSAFSSLETVLKRSTVGEMLFPLLCELAVLVGSGADCLRVATHIMQPLTQIAAQIEKIAEAMR